MLLFSSNTSFLNEDQHWAQLRPTYHLPDTLGTIVIILDRVLQFFLHILLNGFIQLRAEGSKLILLLLQSSSFHRTPFFYYESFACIFLFAMPRNHIATERKMQETDVDGVGVGLKPFFILPFDE